MMILKRHIEIALALYQRPQGATASEVRAAIKASDKAVKAARLAKSKGQKP